MDHKYIILHSPKILKFMLDCCSMLWFYIGMLSTFHDYNKANIWLVHNIAYIRLLIAKA